MLVLIWKWKKCCFFLVKNY